MIEQKHTNFAIFATAVLAFCGVLLETAMNVTFPTLVAQFHTTLNTVQWVTTGYLLAVAATMMITGFIESRMQTRQLVMSALGLFVLGGVICAVSINLAMLLIGRIVQGLATGLIMPLVFALIMVKVPRAQQGRYVGIAGMLIALAPSLGPSYGGFVTQVASWRLSFWMIMPIALIAGVIAIVNMPQVFPQQKLIFPVGQFALLPWIIHRISKKQRNPTIHTGLRCFGVSPIGCAYMLRLSQRKTSRKRGFTPSQL